MKQEDGVCVCFMSVITIFEVLNLKVDWYVLPHDFTLVYSYSQVLCLQAYSSIITVDAMPDQNVSGFFPEVNKDLIMQEEGN